MNEQYNRQIILPEVGLIGQKKLLNSHVLCVGAGGLGSPVLFYLASAGIGKITLVEADRISKSNLGRQILFGSDDAGKKKGEISKNRIEYLNKDVELFWIDEFINSDNAISIAKNCDVIIDCSDNFSTKFLLNDLSYKLAIPLVFGSISQLEGQIAVFDNRTSGSACYRCLYKDIPESNIQNCAEAGILGPVAGIIGSYQALETIKLILQNDKLTTLNSKIVHLDFKTNSFSSFKIKKISDCKTCSLSRETFELRSNQSSNRCKQNSITKQEMESLISKENTVIIDVRENDEFIEKKINNSINLPLSKLNNPDYLKKNSHFFENSKNAIIVCKSGIRSQKALSILKNRFTCQFFNLEGGIINY
ncbi:MAG: HesA/MoeB/ThiF family protein [Bacteriovoracaceae bacterium]